jgi:cell division protein FtsB
MKALKKISSILLNRYFIVSVIFIVWMLFFDQRDYFQQKASAEELQKIQNSTKYYNDEINNTKKQLNNLQGNPTSIEKFARERYLLKREGEELYLFEDTAANKAAPEEKK